MPKPQNTTATLEELQKVHGASGTNIMGGIIYEEYNPELSGIS